MTNPADKSPDAITPGKALERGADQTIRKPPTTDFQSYMQETPGQSSKGSSVTAPPGQTPLDLSRGSPLSQTGPSYNSLLAQAKTAQDSLGVVHEKLNTPNLKLKRSQSHLLRNKLTDARDNLHNAGDKLNASTPDRKLPTGANAIDRFIAYINDGQDQLAAVQQRLKEMAASNQELKPGDMMLIQIKMGQAQQEIEYSSTLLSKVIDSLKTILNTQL